MYNPKLSAFSRGRQFFLIYAVTLSFQFFHMVDKIKVCLLTLRYFSNIMTFKKTNRCRDHPIWPHIS